jgi:hypothetical protein
MSKIKAPEEYFDVLYPDFPEDYAKEWVQNRKEWKAEKIKDMKAYSDYRMKAVIEKLEGIESETKKVEHIQGFDIGVRVAIEIIKG